MPVTPKITRLSDEEFADFVSLVPRDPSTLQPVLQAADRPNVQGWAFRKLARKGQPWKCEAMRDFASVQDARAGVQALRDGLVGELCNVTTSDNTTYGRMMCLEVRELAVRAALLCAGGLTGGGDGGSNIWGEPVAADVKGLAFFEFTFVNVGPDALDE